MEYIKNKTIKKYFYANIYFKFVDNFKFICYNRIIKKEENNKKIYKFKINRRKIL